MSDYGNEPGYAPPTFSLAEGATDRLTVNWAVELNGEAISASAWDGDGLTVGTDTTGTSATTALLSGADKGCSYEVKNTLTTSGGRTLVKSTWVVGA